MKRIRSLSLLLALVLVLSLLPVTASAVYCLDEVDCITALPVADQPLRRDCAVDEGYGTYTARIVGWYVGETWSGARPAAASERPVLGATYWADVEYNPEPGYMLMRDTRVLVNGLPGVDVRYVDAGIVRAAVQLKADCQGLGDIALKVTPPYVGENPGFLKDRPEDPRYTVSVVSWKRGTDWDHLTDMDYSDFFTANETYWVTIAIRPVEGYTVAEPERVTINGFAPDPHSARNPYNHDYYAVCAFRSQWPEPVTRVSMSVGKPSPGLRMKYNVTSGDGEKYGGYVADWYKGTDWATAVPQKDESTYVAGSDYWVQLRVFPEPGYYFPYDPTGRPDGITMEINGQRVQDLTRDERGYLTGAVRLRCGGLFYGFTDVPGDAYYKEPVDWAVARGIASGTTPTTFSPNASCTRAQAVSFLWRAAGCPNPRLNVNPFRDVPASAYYADAVLWAVEQGVTKGLTPTTFGPNAECTRAQIVSFLWNNAGKPSVSGGNPFRDVAPGKYYEKAVLWAVETGVTRGLTPDTFGPNAKCTRGQIACFLYNDAH